MPSLAHAMNAAALPRQPMSQEDHFFESLNLAIRALSARVIFGNPLIQRLERCSATEKLANRISSLMAQELRTANSPNGIRYTLHRQMHDLFANSRGAIGPEGFVAYIAGPEFRREAKRQAERFFDEFGKPVSGTALECRAQWARTCTTLMKIAYENCTRPRPAQVIPISAYRSVRSLER